MKFIHKYLLIVASVIIFLTSFSFAEMGTYELNGVTKKLPVANIYVDGKLYTGSSGIKPLVIDNRMYIAVTDLIYLDDASIGWDSSTESVIINSSRGKISYYKGGSTYILNGETRSLGGNTKFYVVNMKSMVPVSILPIFSNASITYDPKMNATTIVKYTSHEDLIEPDTNDNSTTIKPVIPTNPDVITKPKDPIIAPAGNLKLSLEHRDGNKETINLETDKNVNYETFYLQNPNRLVIDIYNYNAASFDGESITESIFLDKANTSFSLDTNKYRVTLYLKNGVSNTDIKVEKSNTGIKIIYSMQMKTFKYASDRINSELSLSLDKAGVINAPNTNGKNTLVLTIPKINIEMNIGNITYNDRNLTSINTALSGNNYISTITMKDRVSYNMISNGNLGKVVIKFTKTNNQTPTIVIDAGHGGKDPGATNSVKNLNEKSLNLTASTNLAGKLRSYGYNVIETRNSDYFVELKERTNIANDIDADLFISVHHNSGNEFTSGIETLYFPSEDNRSIANIVQKNLINATGAIDRKIQPRGNLVVLNSTKMPAVLLELGFLSNEDESIKIADIVYMNILTDSVVKAVNQYFGR